MNLLNHGKNEQVSNTASESRRLVYHNFDYIHPVTKKISGVVPSQFDQTVKSMIHFEDRTQESIDERPIKKKKRKITIKSSK
jgi:hypothetical protein